MKAVIFGSALIDIIVIVPSESIERMTMDNATASFLLMEQGRKIEAQSVTVHTGGGAVNVAVALSRLGAEVAPMVKLGDDLNAEKVLAHLKEEGVSDRLVMRTEEEPTGTSVMIAAHDRNATIFTNRGANTLLACSDIDDVDLQNIDLVYVAGLSNQSADCFPDIVKRADEGGAMVFANPGIRQLTSRQAAFFESLPHIDCLSINRAEAAALAPHLLSRQSKSAVKQVAGFSGSRHQISFAGFDMRLDEVISRIMHYGPQFCLITDGRHGAYLGHAKGISYCSSHEVVPLGTAGAGDAFGSTVSYFLAKGSSPEEALRAASLNAAAVVSAIDTQSKLLTSKKLEKQLLKEGAALQAEEWPWSG